MGGATLNRIGTNGDGLHDDLERNVISGNLNVGILIEESHGNRIQGNAIGTNALGDAAVGNGSDGIRIINASNIEIGGGFIAQSNLVSGNQGSGIVLSGALSTLNSIHGNLVGTNASGTASIPNAQHGVWIDGASGNFVGGSTDGTGNLLSGNAQDGIQITGSDASNNSVLRNRIGTKMDGSGAIPNGRSGISIQQGAHGNRIGGSNAGDGNLISGNSSHGLQIAGTGTDGNQIQGNKIGVDLAGLVANGNGANGVSIELGASQNVVGGASISDRNWVGGNLGAGISLSGTTTSANLIQGTLWE